MSLADRIPSEDRSLDARGVAFVLSFSAFAFAGFVLLVYTLQRLGMAANISTSLVALWIGLSVLLLSWLGRSATGSRFFFASRKGEAISMGLGGAFCWFGGAVMATFFALPPGHGFILLVSLLLGLALQAFLFVLPADTGKRSTLPGLLARRFGMRGVGLVSMGVCVLVLCSLAIAEFDIAVRLFSELSGLSEHAVLFPVAALVVLPILFGGWQALLLTNACIGVWALFSMLAPALISGFLPSLLSGHAQAGIVEPIVFLTVDGLFDTATPFESLTALIVFSVGFAVLPQTMARNVLAGSRMTAVEGLGWAGLVIFLALSTLFLSIALIINSGAESNLGRLLRSSATISALPHAALFFAAFNALSATLFVAATTIVRSVRAHGDREPGVASMFFVRLLVLLMIGALIAGRDYVPFNVPELLLSALALAAAGLFPVLFASLWFRGSSGLFAMAATIIGAGCTITAYSVGQYDVVMSGALGGVTSTATVLIGHLWTRMHVESEKNEEMQKA